MTRDATDAHRFSLCLAGVSDGTQMTRDATDVHRFSFCLAVLDDGPRMRRILRMNADFLFALRMKGWHAMLSDGTYDTD